MSQPPHLNAIAAKRERVEFLARIVAAEQANRVDDPCGDQLPSEAWQRCLPEARAIMTLLEKRP